jgi:predicted DNA-binding transcriptional regulator YafY
MSHALERQIRMLQLLPPHPKKITVQLIAERLQSEGLAIEERTIQRHLVNLSKRFPIGSDEGKPAGWNWAAGAEPIQMPLVDPGTALTYTLVEEHLGRLLPRPLFEQLQSQFRDVRMVLDAAPDRAFKRWSERVALVPFGPERIPATIEDSVIPAVYTALLEGKQLRLHYRNAQSTAAREHVVHPLGLAGMDGVFYLVAVAEGYEEPRQWALQRMSRVEVLDRRAVEPPDFNFGAYIKEQRAFQYTTHRQVRLELRVTAWWGRLFEERPLSTDQTVRPIRGSEDMRVIARVELTEQLHWWLRSLGRAVEVLKPASLRAEFAAEFEELAQRYGSATP